MFLRMATKIVLFDDFVKRNSLLPLVATRPVGNLRVGILTIDQKWASIFQTTVSYHTVAYLSNKFPLVETSESPVLFIKATILPSEDLVYALQKLESNQCLVDSQGDWIGAKFANCRDFALDLIPSMRSIAFTSQVQELKHPEDIYLYNTDQILFDLDLIGITATIPTDIPEAKIVGSQLYLKDNVNLKGAYLDSSKGPIYIGDNSLIEPGVVINGPVAIGANCRVKSGAILYPNVSIGDHSTISGEINNVVIWGRTSKGHDGYLGCAVLGEGCNLGAGTVNSNLRNDWNSVKLYDYPTAAFRDTTLSKCGVIIADYVMLGIQSKINTGTVIGVGAQIAMSKIIPKFVPDFSWYTDVNQDSYIFDRFVQMMRRKAELKQEDFDIKDLSIWEHIYASTMNLRNK